MVDGPDHRNFRAVIGGRADSDSSHGLAIAREIGERLQSLLREEPELPPPLRKKVERLRETSTSRAPDVARRPSRMVR